MNLALDNNPFAGLLARLARLADRSDAPRHAPAAAPAAEHERGLVKGALFSVARPLGRQVVCVEGALWITHDGDVKDLVLERGQRYVAERSARMTVQALDHAVLQLT